MSIVRQNAGFIRSLFIKKYFEVYDPKVNTYFFKPSQDIIDPRNNYVQPFYMVSIDNNESREKGLFEVYCPATHNVHVDVTYQGNLLTIHYPNMEPFRIFATLISEAEKDKIIIRRSVEKDRLAEETALNSISNILNVKLNLSNLQLFEQLVIMTVDKYKDAFNVNKEGKLILCYSTYNALYADGVITYESRHDNKPSGSNLKELTIKYIETLNQYISKVNTEEDFFDKLKSVLDSVKGAS